jgi:hypothetical protein
LKTLAIHPSNVSEAGWRRGNRPVKEAKVEAAGTSKRRQLLKGEKLLSSTFYL